MRRPTVAEARAHHDALADALAALERPTPCQGEDRDFWTSDDSEDQALAVAACLPCPVMEACRKAGRTEAAGTWGGFTYGRRDTPTDYEPEPRTRTATSPADRWVEPVLIALATRPRPGPTGGLARDAEALRPGDHMTGPALGHALRQLREAGHAHPHHRGGLVELTDQGQAAAEALTW